MNSRRKPLIGGFPSNRIEIKFHKNPLNSRLPRPSGTCASTLEVPRLNSSSVALSPIHLRSPLHSPSNKLDVNGSKVILEPVHLFTSQNRNQSNRSIGNRSCVSEFVPVRKFEPEQLPKVTPNSFLGDIPRVNLASRDNRSLRQPLFGQRTSSSSRNSNTDLNNRHNGSFKFVTMPLSFNFTTQNGVHAAENDRFRLSTASTAGNLSGLNGERSQSRASDVSNISINSAISSRTMNGTEEDQDEKKRRLLQAIRMKDRRRSLFRDTASMYTSLSHNGDELGAAEDCSYQEQQFKRKRTLDSSHDDEDSRRELTDIFAKERKRRYTCDSPLKSSQPQTFKNNEILSSYSSLVYSLDRNRSIRTAKPLLPPEPEPLSTKESFSVEFQPEQAKVQSPPVLSSSSSLFKIPSSVINSKTVRNEMPDVRYQQTPVFDGRNTYNGRQFTRIPISRELEKLSAYSDETFDSSFQKTSFLTLLPPPSASTPQCSSALKTLADAVIESTTQADPSDSIASSLKTSTNFTTNEFLTTSKNNNNPTTTSTTLTTNSNGNTSATSGLFAALSSPFNLFQFRKKWYRKFVMKKSKKVF